MDVHGYSVKKVLGEVLFRLAKTRNNLILNIIIIIIMALVIITTVKSCHVKYLVFPMSPGTIIIF